MSDQNMADQTEQSLNTAAQTAKASKTAAKYGLKTGKAAAKAGAKGTKAAASGISKLLATPAGKLALVLIIVLFLVSVLVGAMSGAETNAVTHVNETVDPAPTDYEEKQKDWWDKGQAKERADDIMAVITSFTQKEYAQIETDIQKTCNKNGWDPERTLAAAQRNDSESLDNAAMDVEDEATLPAATDDAGDRVTGDAVVQYAKQFLGTKYVWGGTSLTKGVDCSGFTMQVFKHFHVSLPHRASEQEQYGKSVSLSAILPGDLLCYGKHVGIYVGDEKMIHASTSKGKVSYTTIHYKPIKTIRRLVKAPSESDAQPGNKEDSKEGKVLQTWDLSHETGGNRATMTVEHYNQNWTKGTLQRRLHLEDKKSYTDAKGFRRYMAGSEENEKEDYYVIALGSRFGNTIYNKYRITMKASNRTSQIICILGDQKADGDTDETNSFHLSDGSWLEVATDPKVTSASTPKNIDPSVFLGKLTKIELIDGEFVNNLSAGATQSTNRVLSAYSVSISNLQVKKIAGKNVYYDNQGNQIAASWWTNEPNFEKDIQKKLKRFVQEGGRFYEVDYEKNMDGSIKVYSESVEYQPGEVGGIPAINNLKDPAGQGKTIRWVVPTITAVDIDDICESLFGIDPDAQYVNGGGHTTNREAIDTLSKNTAAILYDGDPNQAEATESTPVFSSELGGKFAWPLPGHTHLSSKFGFRQCPFHGSEFHPGVDIPAPTGTPVVATENGTVLFAGYKKSYGNCVEIQHTKGIKSMYSHMSKIEVQGSGKQKVTRGQEIGKVGETGDATGPHLDFRIFINDKAVNPIPLTKK